MLPTTLSSPVVLLPTRQTTARTQIFSLHRQQQQQQQQLITLSVPINWNAFDISAVSATSFTSV
jgi:hypothetical protein